MPNRRIKYVDMEKYKATLREQTNRYYAKTAHKGVRRNFSKEEDINILNHELTDSEMSKITGHSVASIQKRRWVLKKKNNL